MSESVIAPVLCTGKIILIILITMRVASNSQFNYILIPLDSLFKPLVVVVRSLHSLGSCLLDSLFSFRCNSNSTSTATTCRAQVTTCLALPDVRTRSGLQSLSYTATKEWNSLPRLIRCVCSQPCIFVII